MNSVGINTSIIYFRNIAIGTQESNNITSVKKPLPI